MKIDLPITTGLPWHTPIVEAELVNVAPHLDATFAVHRDPYSKRRWQVSHVETGKRASPSYTTRAMAVKKAEIILRAKTQEQLVAAEEAALEESPWINGELHDADMILFSL